ncbi:MAG: type II methionyl aminopeptidase [Candidatus Diapherotrites archaeon]|nr:type II methionyl aminopeptidase [Candidatus Diapherotrites archaeon]
MEGEKEHLQAGKIATKALEFGKNKAKPGMRIEELADAVEAFIKEEGGGLAFPVNTSLNEVAAHQIAKFKDDTVIGENDLMKLDLGVHLEGYIVDCAVSVDFSGEQGKLVEASRAALDNVISIIKPGIDVSILGAEVQKTIKKYGFNPIQNLCGHSIDRYDVHSGLSIPNIESREGLLLPEEGVIAIEPFACTGLGFIGEGGAPEIYESLASTQVRARGGREIVAVIDAFKGLPFAKRWLDRQFSPLQVSLTLRELVQKNVLRRHPPLKEKKGILVSQAETSFLLLDGDVKVLIPEV